MCNAYFIFAALVFLVMAWDRWGRVVREYNENDVFFEKWYKCCGMLLADQNVYQNVYSTEVAECNKDYEGYEKKDQGRVNNICIKYQQIRNTPAPETLQIASELAIRNWESL